MLCVILSPLTNSARAQGSNETFKVDLSFDHKFTRFPLYGAHVKVTCEKCHEGAVFKGVPTTCFGCHNGDMALSKPDNHPETTNECADCHSNTKFNAVHVDHSKISGKCFSCHNGKTATGKNKGHVKSSNSCSDCHVTTTWAIPKFDHKLTQEPCEKCHDNQQAEGKPFNHIRSSNDCASCHTTIAWNIGVFDHTGIVDGCAKCHDGVQATGKSPTHFLTSELCESCHTTIAWSPAHFDHNLAGDVSNCAGCHDGRRATGRSIAHFRTTNDCGACHVVTAWKPAKFDHALTPDLSSCFTCHNGSRPPALGKRDAQPPHVPSSNNCTDCHDANNFVTWATGVTFNHVGIIGNCVSCHNGSRPNALSKKDAPGGHLATTDSCESCHSNSNFTTWATNKFDHSQSSGPTCLSCHDGTKKLTSGNNIVGKMQGPTGKHITNPDVTQNTCENCHNTSSFVPSSAFDHTLTVTTCFTCHNGTAAIMMGPLRTKNPATHIASSNACEDCHNTTNWNAAAFDHSGIGAARCDSCHNNNPVKGLPPTGHVAFNGGADCLSCHTSTSSWKVIAFDHGVVSTSCFTCHNGTFAISTGAITSKSNAPNHIQSDNTCETCHTSFTTWKAAFNHANIGSATCLSCHNGINATGKLTITGKHMSTSDLCESCHTTTAWKPVTKFDHTQTTVTTCFTCHNNIDAVGKSKTHITSKDTCQNCHNNFVTWIPAAMDHGFATGTCFSCHDGAHSTTSKAITGKNLATHFKTTNNCANCHNVNVWKPATTPFDHTQASGTCLSCHDGLHAPAKGKKDAPGGHLATGDACENCHTTSAWIPASFSHTDPKVAATPCVTCHGAAPVTNAQNKASAPMLGAVSPHVATSDLCESCHTTTRFFPARMDHMDGVVAGKTCASCHDTGKAPSPVRPASHPPFVGQDCKDCHSTTTWITNAKPDHTNFVGNCIQCHTGAPGATGKLTITGKHLTTSDNCDACHNTTAFKPATFDHNDPAVVPQTCANCHNTGMPFAVVRPTNHPPIAVGQDCAACHVTTTWVTNAKPDHTNFVNNCVTCHTPNGTALPKSPTHLTTSNNCDACHNTAAFKPATFDHNEALPQPLKCNNCHDNAPAHLPAVGKSQTHFLTSTACESCHTSVTAWAPANLKHDDPIVAGATCISCHDGNHLPAVPKTLTHFKTSNDCAACHTTIAWKPTGKLFDHAQATGTCLSCHDGAHKPAKGKIDAPAPGHLPTSNVCEDCHNVNAWKPAVFSHAGVTGTCFSCHNGTRATGKGPTHFATSTLCESCHVNTAWVPAKRPIDHTQVTGTCYSCHTPTKLPAFSKGPTHLTTSNACEACHNTNKFVPATRPVDHTQVTGSCFSCHNNTKVAGKSGTHFATTNTCENCHTTTKWTPAKRPFDHTQATGTCVSCHVSPKMAAQFVKTATHLTTTTACDACHNTTKFTPAIRPVDHSQVTGTCFSCHNNTKVAGKSGAHITTTNACESCHVTTKWTPAVRPVDHTQVTGTCVSCHVSPKMAAQFIKTATHMNTSNNCDFCHTTLKFKPAAFDHSQTTAACSTCHKGQFAGVKSWTVATHLVTAVPCDVCHTTTSFTPALPYTHTSPAYVNHGANTPTCISCHKQNNEMINYARPDLFPDCAACHVNRYKPDPHKKYTTPNTVLYTVDELRNCTGACHIYSNSTLTTIKTRRAGPQHNATRPAWN